MTYKVLQIGNPTSPLNYGNGLAAQSDEIEIHWYSHIKGDLPNVKHHSIPNWIGRNYVLRAIFEPFYVARVIRQIDPDLIQVHYASKGLATLPIVRQQPLIVTTMGSDIAPDYGYKFPFRYWIDLILRKATKVTTRSGFMKKRLLKMGVPEEKIIINSWGIDLDHFSRKTNRKKLKQKWSAPSDAFIFFDPRSTHPLYNKDIIIKAFAKAATKTTEKIHLLVAGIFATDSQKAALHQLVDQLEITEQVTFLGSVDYEQMPELYSLAECTVSVPSSDGMPQTIFEAWACGSYLIIGDLPQYDEFVDDVSTAKRVPLRDVQKLSEAMLWVMAEERVRTRAIKLGRERAIHFADRKVQKKGMRDLVMSLLKADDKSLI
jgi:glycosyltransferase involved in cell wall biosynthesis